MEAGAMTQLLPTGDRGQPFEIRYRNIGDKIGVADKIGAYRVLGWSSTLKGARQMRDTWIRAPGVETVWFVDRRRSAE
jgi:hypothetical protein